MSVNRPLYVSGGAEVLVAVRFRVATAVAASATDYHTMTVTRRRPARGALQPAQQFGETVGTFTTRDFALVAGEAATLYPAPADARDGLRLDDGDALWGSIVQTGSPAVLDGPAFELEVQ